MPTAAKEETFAASSDPCVLFPLAAAGVYPKTRVWGSNEKNLACFSATAPLRIELRWGYENSSEKTVVGSGVSFKYDPFGRRIYKSSTSGTSVYAYDGDNLVEETNSSGGVVARYAQTQNVDEPLAMLRSSATSYYQADGLGSVTSLSNAAGALAQTYTYDSFGNQTASSGSLTNPFRYTAREFDSETSLYFMRARYFDPQTGRFINEDPAGFDAGSPNFYVYVGNDPTDGIDPYGLKCIRKLMLVTAYSDPGPGKDWPYFAPKKRGGKPGGAGPGIVAVANTNPPPYPFGSGVTVSNNPDPFGSDNPLAGPAYGGNVHDTGAGWDPNHHNVSPDDWIDIWLPHKQAIKWGKQWRWVTICTPDTPCSSAPNFFDTYKFGGNAFE